MKARLFLHPILPQFLLPFLPSCYALVLLCSWCLSLRFAHARSLPHSLLSSCIQWVCVKLIIQQTPCCMAWLEKVKRTYNPCSREAQLQWGRYQHKQLKLLLDKYYVKGISLFSICKAHKSRKWTSIIILVLHMMKGLETQNGTHQNSPSSEWVGCMEYFCCCFQVHHAATSVSSFMISFVHVSLEYLQYFFSCGSVYV